MRRGIVQRFVLSALGALGVSAWVQAQVPKVADAAMQGDAQAVHQLLKDGADVNSAQGDGMTALHWAAMKDQTEMVHMLLYAGANVKAATRLGGYTPIAMAARNGNAEILGALLDAGSDPNVATSTGTTPLMLAAASGHASAVNLLATRGANVNGAEHAMGQTPLMFAAASNRLEAMSALLTHGADISATTKVVDLYAFSREVEEEFRRQISGAASGAAPSTGGSSRSAGAPSPTSPEPNAGAAPQPAAERRRGDANKPPAIGGRDRQFLYNELVGYTGGLTPLLLAARNGYTDAVKLLLESGADINQVSAGDRTSPMLIAIVNGHYDLAKYLLDRGADPNLGAENGVAPLYGVLNVQWAPKALYPQPRAYLQQKLTHLELMTALLDKGADPNARLNKKVWYSGYNFDLAGVDEIGATPFWRAAYASDVDAMRLLVARGADPNVPTTKPAGRPRTGDGGRESTQDVSKLPPVPVGGPAVTPLQAAAGVGYGEGFAANSHRFAPGGMLAAVKYLVEEMGADVNARDHEGNTALHHAAARGDVEMINYLVAKGADVTVVNREGQTTADMANGPVQRTQPFPDALDLLMKLGAKNNNKCVSC